MDRKSENIFIGSLLFTLFIVFTVVIFYTENSYGGGDHFSHFKLAYWGWKYPDMLFNHWGKPVFTILISPFAQFGINGARFFNMFIGLATAFFCWRLAVHFRFKYAWLVIILVLFTPIYFIVMFTSLTEPLFSFFLVLAIFLFFKERFIWSAIVISFMPMIRTEGIILIPLFILAWSMKRKFLAIPFLLLGFVMISLLGYGYYDNLWWLVDEIPYTGTAKEIYGSGSLFYFANNNYSILGPVLGYFFLFSIFAVLYNWKKRDGFKLNDQFYFLLLVVGSFVVFFSAHSIAWWQGIGNSLGLYRVIASVAPLAALTAGAGITSIYYFHKNKWWRFGVQIALILMMYFFVDNGIKNHKYGFYISEPQQMLTETADYLKENQYDQYKIYYYNGYLAQIMNFDPRDPAKSQKYLPRKEDFLKNVPNKSIIVWDAHFGPNEGKMPLDKLMNHEDFKVLKVLKPDVNFKVLGGYDYKIVIFQNDLLFVE